MTQADLDEQMLAELRRVAVGPAPSGRAAQAKVAAIRTLERFGKRPGGKRPTPLDDEGRFHPGPPEMWELDRGDSDEQRELWARRLGYPQPGGLGPRRSGAGDWPPYLAGRSQGQGHALTTG
jgi:hypothetical protein